MTIRNNDTLAVIAVMGLWAACYPLITIGLPYAPHLTFAAMRAALAGGVLLLVAALIRAPLPRGGKTWAWLCVAGFGATTLGYLGMFHAAEFVAPGFATVIANAQPLIASVLAFVVLHERLGPRAHIGLVIGFAGIVVVAAPGIFSGSSISTAKGVAYVLLAATGVSIGNVAIKRIAVTVAPSSAMGWQLIIGAVPLAFLAALTEDPLAVTWTPQFTASLVGLSLFGTALAFWLWQRVLTRMDLSRANAFSFLVPFMGITFGALFFKEAITLQAVAGAIISIVGISLVFAPRR
ncbi:MAG: DMT family transporter [Alphaproteobacteria bacterium]|nr:DMT family transporter [Alphaproteobacteria bacterium]